ncbi:MAG: hypothetical protein DRQ06_01470 [Candidatus Hydrothermota bacterium]|uniref:Helix-hairpin-helix domain-containing protein n=1 Tax=candidate division WOR-3 bacterium TaxID=2052148 RepID=A0A7C0XAZ7_UNCW3|nr:MAG: hypothetical protein DRQ06_01470 [Candidatus Hydrothermae bacterium]RKZ05013.1 MAG: hypothetical protein DRQ04_00175 [Candidatus Hydrothermae bacterium]HDM90242.1 helix-hairpin-helix domain-containing protein [candidate division WOR-3 bacterium]
MDWQQLKINLQLSREETAILIFLVLSFTLGNILLFIEKGRSKVKKMEETARPIKSIFPIDLNSARYDELILLPGIGKKTAKRIIELRRKKGGFRRIEDLLEVPGIGPKKLEALRDKVMISP